jgi:major vault protein
MSDAQKRDLVLAPGTFAYIQDTTKGVIKTYAGPTAFSPSGQEIPVKYDRKTGTFQKCATLDEAVRTSPVAVEGFYIMLLNPSKNGKQPEEGAPQSSADLDVGRKVNIPGPAMFPLWPGQAAEVIRGHYLRSNQFLLCRVYNEEEAKKNWSNSIMKSANSKLTPPPADATEEVKKQFQTDLEKEKKELAASLKQPDLTVGKLFIIRGTDVSFYIPPTGISVVQEGTMDAQGRSTYVREALTLENLEYCILVDENGNTRYERGPSVVFPEPTEKFMTASNEENGEQVRKFRAIDLNKIQGIHIKVIADYEEHGQKFKAGDELFITGKETAIYYPRKEHSAVKYDGKTKHFATAVPSGEARYVLNRETGVITMKKGPDMLLPDPRIEIIVRRVLSDKQCELWYPGNGEALDYNRNIRKVMQASPTTRAGAVSEGDISRRSLREAKYTKFLGGVASGGMEFGASNQAIGSTSAFAASSTPGTPSPMISSQVSKEQGYVGEEFLRSSTYTQPRSMTLDTKFQGAPTIGTWTGYAVMVVSKTGKRRVEKGPVEVQLEYDESLEVLEFSTGKPKNTDRLIKSPYLRVENNKISDTIRVETSDHVFVEVYLSYRVNFEGDPMRWFLVENYVKFLCDHVRSVLKGYVRGIKVEDFYAHSTDIIHDTILGEPTENGDRLGMVFKENGMRILDAEVLGVKIENEQIRAMMENTQHNVVKTNIEIADLKRRLDFTQEKESVEREEAQIRTMTVKTKNQLEQELLQSSIALILAKLSNAFKELEQQKNLETSRQELENFVHGERLNRQKKETDQRLSVTEAELEQQLTLLVSETENVVKRFGAAQAGFSEALLALSNNETIKDVARSWSIQTVIGGESLVDSLKELFSGTPLKEKITKVLETVASSAVATNGKTLTSGTQPKV